MFENDFVRAKNTIFRLLKRSKRGFNLFANTLTPQQCVLCQSTIHTAACAICSTPMPLNTKELEGICGVCLKTNRHWSLCTAAYEYCEPVSDLIHQFKYQHELRLKYTLCHALIENVEFQESLPDFLIPVPMHYSRLAKRGYNHSLILAKTLSERLNIPVIHAVKKVHETPSLTKLSSKERAKTIKQSFELDTVTTKNLLNGKHVAIIDDVVTTGTTSSEVAKVLLQAKPRDIVVWCIART